jgi:hypothetical protein
VRFLFKNGNLNIKYNIYNKIMGTRALIGYLNTDQTPAKLTTTYNHYDGYPENLGVGLENFYNSDAKAEEIANVGYISYLDPETGEWDAKNKLMADVTTLPDNFNEAMMTIAEEIDKMGGDYGYIWDNENGEWITIPNNGIGRMAKDLELNLAHLKDKFAMMPERPDQTPEIPGFEGTRAALDDLFEEEQFIHKMKYRAGIIK